MLEAIFNVAFSGLAVAFGFWWAVTEGLQNALAAQQATRQKSALEQLLTWLEQLGCGVKWERIEDKVKEVQLAWRVVPDELGALAVSRERALLPLCGVVAVIAVSLLAEMGIHLGTFEKAGARAVSLLACWVALVLEAMATVMVLRVGREYRWREALRSLLRP
jgi:hypothetical protein